jgi:hypothetical protein
MKTYTGRRSETEQLFIIEHWMLRRLTGFPIIVSGGCISMVFNERKDMVIAASKACFHQSSAAEVISGLKI